MPSEQHPALLGTPPATAGERRNDPGRGGPLLTGKVAVLHGAGALAAATARAFVDEYRHPRRGDRPRCCATSTLRTTAVG